MVPPIFHRVTHQGPCPPDPQSCVVLEANQTVRRKRAHWAASCRHCLPTTTDFSSSRKTLLGCRDKHEQGLLGNTCFKKWTLSAFSLWHQGPWELSRLLGLPVVLLLTGPRKVKVLMGQAQPPKCKLSKAPLEISGMFSVQSIGYFPVRESCDYNEGYSSLLTTLEDKDGWHLPTSPETDGDSSQSR